jgi:MoxR-like ATPase
MTVIKAGAPLIELVKLCYAAKRPLLLVGRHGVGKSEVLEQAAGELGIEFVPRDLSLMEPPDLVGLPKLDERVTRYLPPAFLPTEGRGLLAIEELNRAPAYMRAPCLQLLTHRTLNDYRLPAGWLPVAAVNPEGQSYEVDELDPALRSRFVQVGVEPDREEWLHWARRNGIHPAVIAYVESDPSVFAQPESSPRAWAYVSDILHAATRSPWSRESLRAAVVGLVGAKRGAAFLRVWSDDVKPLTAAEILAYPRHRARFRGWVDAGRLDLVRGSVLAISKHLQPRQNYELVKGDRTSWRNLGTFLGDLPGDLREEAAGFFRERGYEVPQARGGGR